MSVRYWVWPVAGALSLVLGACGPGYMNGAGSGGYVSVGTGWQSAWYDQDGFPVYGYEGGRPVYGYTPAGAAIFSLSLLTADCYVPHWEPASWYRGSYRYPVRVRRISEPPRHPAAHKPSYRPARPTSREANREMYRNSHQPLARKNTPPKPQTPVSRPVSPSPKQHAAPRAKAPTPPQTVKQSPKPGAGRPSASSHEGNLSKSGRVPQVSKPSGNAPRAGKTPTGRDPRALSRPAKTSSAKDGKKPSPPAKFQQERGKKH